MKCSGIFHCKHWLINWLVYCLSLWKFNNTSIICFASNPILLYYYNDINFKKLCHTDLVNSHLTCKFPVDSSGEQIRIGTVLAPFQLVLGDMTGASLLVLKSIITITTNLKATMTSTYNGTWHCHRNWTSSSLMLITSTMSIITHFWHT